MSTKTAKAKKASEVLEEILGPVSLGRLLESIRKGEEWTQPEMAKMLGISKSHLNDIEKGRKFVSPERAAMFARKLGYSESQFVKMSFADQIREAGLDLKVEVKGVA